MRSRLNVAIAVVLLLGPGLLACFDGGYFDRPRLWAAIAAWALLAVVAVALPRPLPASTPGRLALGGLAALTVWTAVSLAWAPDGSPAGDDLQRLLLYLPYFAAAIAVVRRPLAEPLLLAAITGACAYGLAERFGVIDLEAVATAGDRLAYPLSYWNATGAFAAIGLILAAALAGERSRVAAATAPLLALTLVLTFSRGAFGALAAGLLVLLAVSPTRARIGGVLVIVAGGIAAGLLSAAFGGLRTEAGTSPAALPLLLAAMAACAAFPHWSDVRVPWLRTAALGAAVLVLAGTLAATLSIERVRDDPGAGAERLASVQSNRYAYWKVAVEAFADRPLTGEGTGGFRTAWLREREFAEAVRDGHSLYLETAAELGLVGLLALGLLVAGCALAAVRAGPAAAGSIAALSAFALHAGIDWDLPALTLVGLALAAGLIASQEAGGAADARAP
jgi:hypothetical protein